MFFKLSEQKGSDKTEVAWNSIHTVTLVSEVKVNVAT